MNISILSIGDELVRGEVIDTNAAVIAGSLVACGLKVRHHLTVGDAEPDIVEAVQALSGTSDVAIVTGGLGPTTDDLTARAAARATGRRLVLNNQALAHVRLVAEKLGDAVAALNEKQAYIPDRSKLIPNPRGTACGFFLTHGGALLFFLPGVPAEMRQMLEETVVPVILERAGQKKCLQTAVLKVFGPSEAEVNQLLRGVADAGSPVTVAYGVDFPEIFVKLRGEGENPQVVAEALALVRNRARQKLAEFIYAEDDETMDSMVARLSLGKGITLSLAESCTGGLLAKRITDVAGSSAYFLMGVVTYSNAAKSALLGVSPQLLDEEGAVSAETAMAMARGVRTLSGSDLALAVTGIAGPVGGTAEKPVGTVFIALDSRDGCRAREYHFRGNRQEIREITTFAALDWLRRYLLSL